MNIRSLMPLIALSLAAPGCARTLDLDAPAVQPSNEPGVLGTAHEVIISHIAVDGQRLYWAGSSVPPRRGFVQSCQMQDCPGTIVTYDVQEIDYPGIIFSVKGGQVYWYRASSQELVACPVAGCNGSPRSVLKAAPDLLSESLSDGIAFDDERFYFTDQIDSNFSLYSIALNQPGARQLIASSPSLITAVTADESYVYWFTREGLSSSGPSYDPVGYGGLFRTRKDGTSAVETIAKDVKDAPGSGFSITTDPRDIYWTNNVLSGSISRCPLAGCSGASEVVTGPLRTPQNLLIDGSELYYVYEAQPYEYALAACALPACAHPLPLFDKLVVPSALAMDDQYLYLVTSEDNLGDLTDDFSGDFISQIRRLPKPNQGLP